MTTTTTTGTTPAQRRTRPTALAERMAAADWTALAEEIDTLGCALTPRLLGPADCRALIALYDDPSRFRSTVDMARHRFGSGQYRYGAHSRPGPGPHPGPGLPGRPGAAPTGSEHRDRRGQSIEPPVTSKRWPVIQRDASEARNAATSAMSEGRPIRLNTE